MNRLFSNQVSDQKYNSIKKEILTYYIRNSESTITELSKSINLSIPTVTKFINELLKDGFLTEFGKMETSGGRPPTIYGLNPNSGYFIGVEITPNRINLGLANFKGDLIDYKLDIPYIFVDSDQSMEEFSENITAYIEHLTIDKEKIYNININIPGRVNPKLGYSYHRFIHYEQALADIFRNKLGFKVTIDNDTRAMAYGEFLQGCVKDEKNILFVNVSWGLGLGIITDGKLYLGQSGFSGEFGHIPAFDNEIICHCGKKGCLETEASGLAFRRILTERIKNGETSILSERVLHDETPISLEEIIDAVNKDDFLCLEILEDIGQKLGRQIAGLINIFNPELVIIGGKLAETEDYLIDPIKTAIKKYSLRIAIQNTEIKSSQLKEKAGVVGACMLARHRAFVD